MIFTSLLCLAAIAPSEGTPAFHVVQSPIGTLKATLPFTSSKSDASVNNWLLALAQPPETFGQSDVTVTLNVPGVPARLHWQQEQGGLGRKYAYTVIPDPSGGSSISGQVIYQATLYAQRVVAGPAPQTTSSRAQKFFSGGPSPESFLATHKASKAAPFQNFLDTYDLRRKAGESDRAFAFRTYQVYRRIMRYGPNGSDLTVTGVISQMKGDCGALALGLREIWKEGKLPSKLVFGRTLNSSNQVGMDGTYHTVVTFFSSDGGWYPYCDITAAITNSKAPDLQYFGSHDGRFFAIHEENDLQVQAPSPFGTATYRWLQSIETNSSGNNVQGSWDRQQAWIPTLAR